MTSSINDSLNQTSRSHCGTDHQASFQGAAGDANDDYTFLRPNLIENNQRIAVIPPNLDHKGLNMPPKESNIIINRFATPAAATCELPTSKFFDPDSALKALVHGKNHISEEFKMIAKDSVLPTFGCELTHDKQK